MPETSPRAGGISDTSPRATSGGAPLLEMVGIDKRFPGVYALQQVDFALRHGEIHVLVGENGAGKSTLVKVLSGSIQKDGGRVLLEGREQEIESPWRARELGIEMVYQELSVVPTLSVAENIFLGRLPRTRLGFVRWREVESRARETLGSLGVEIDPRAKLATLAVAEQQLTEIARALSRKSKILILDEPTSALSDAEIYRLFSILRKLRDAGVGIMFISHRLGEAFEIGERITVLRDGRLVGTFPMNEVDEATVIRHMVGRELKERFPRDETATERELLVVQDLRVPGILHGVSFSLRAGEILAIFGAVGSGKTTLARALFGLERRAAGSIKLGGRAARFRSPTEAIESGLAFVTEDRKKGLISQLAVTPNITLANLRAVCRRGFVRGDVERREADRFVKSLRIATPSLTQKVFRLSGGNQQKVVLAKWLFCKSRVLILDEPTRGIDVGAKAEVFQIVNALAREGVGVILISHEMPEVLGMADRILVMHRGTFVTEFPRGTASQESLLAAASGLGGAASQ